jgi:hypothetical protein
MMQQRRNQWVILREYYRENSPAGKEIFNINHILPGTLPGKRPFSDSLPRKKWA